MNTVQRYAYANALTGENAGQPIASRYCQMLPGGWAVCLSFNK